MGLLFDKAFVEYFGGLSDEAARYLFVRHALRTFEEGEKIPSCSFIFEQIAPATENLKGIH